METQASNIFISIWNRSKSKPLGSGPRRIPEQGLCSTYLVLYEISTSFQSNNLLTVMLNKMDLWKGWSCKNCAAGGNVQCNLLHTCVECLIT